MAALLVASCTNSTSPEIEDSLDLFSGLEAISEAQNTNVTINRGTDTTDGYFEITVEGVDANPFLAPGAHEAWCLEWHKNLRSNGDVHSDVKWFSTGDNDTWKPLNYLFSIRQQLQAEDPDLTFRDLQAVVWVLAGEMGIAPAFDVLNLPVDRIPSRLRAGDELAIDREKVASIAKRVMQEAPEVTGLPSGVVAQTAADQQDTYTPPAIQVPTLNQTVDFDQRTLVLTIHAGANATLEAIEFTNLVNLQIVEVVGGTFSGFTVTPASTSEVEVKLAAVDLSSLNFQYFVEITNSRSEVTEYGEIGLSSLDTAARTFTVLLDAGSGNTLTDIDLTGTTGLNASIIDGGFGFQSATILFVSNGSDSFTFALKAVNDKHQVFDFGQISLTWPSEKQRIAFRSERDGNEEIYVIDTDGTNLTRLTNNIGTDTEHSISADGQRVAFMSRRDGNNFDIYVVDTDGSNLTRLTTYSGIDGEPSISADGQRIAFRSDQGFNDDIYVVDADGTNLKRLTTNSGSDLSAKISADGQRVAFISRRHGDQEIYIVDADGNNLTRLTNNTATDGQPSISADGQRVAFLSTRNGNVDIYVVDADGLNLTRLTDGGFDNFSPSISADGQRVAFLSRRDGNDDIYVVDADGSNLTRLTTNISQDVQPSISPDGQRIAFTSFRNGSVDIYVVNTDGLTSPTRLTTNAEWDTQPSISGTTP